MSKLAAIKKFFENNGQKVTMDELKALSVEEKTELAAMAAEELGVKLK